MADYIQFTLADGGTLLAEVEEGEIAFQKGIQKAGLKEIAHKTVAIAKTSFEQAIQQNIHGNAQAFLLALSSLPVAPDEADISFGLKITGELGNVAVAKTGGEANYAVKLLWKKVVRDEETSGH